VVAGLTSIHWREAWKYGERAYRYCQHDVGHAIGAVALAARLLGWECRHLAAWTDDDVESLLGVNGVEGPEAEHPDCLLALYPADVQAPEDLTTRPPDTAALREAATLPLLGTPSVLSPAHHPWPAIDAVARGCRHAGGPPSQPPALVTLPRPSVTRPLSARRLLRGRRSAVALDGVTRMPRDDFFRILSRLLPAPGVAPFASLHGPPGIHLALLVHRVDDLEPGIYLLPRDQRAEPRLRQALSSEFQWRSVAEGESLPLIRLRAGDLRGTARDISCGQDIAADGIFAVAMLAELGPRLDADGPAAYRFLHWEAGAIGQVLYLEAEAAGIRGTGIGCFFDDTTHELLGIRDDRLQTLYHFTVGGPVEDGRLRTTPAYGHRNVLD
jgi:nitroreductase